MNQLDRIWPRLAPAPLSAGRIKSDPTDFVVVEQLPFEPGGGGEHVWVLVQKTDRNTRDVADQLARTFKAKPADVGYAGLKDKRAVTTQWFSIPVQGSAVPDVDDALGEGIEVLRCLRHSRKLRTGANKANHFVIRLRDCAGDLTGVANRIERIRQQGVPNFFGEQRFGIGRRNLREAEALFAGSRSRVSRFKRGLYLSAARSWLFNQILADRLESDRWQRPQAGDVFMPAGSHGFFVPDALDDEVARRFTAGEIELSGPLWGRGNLPGFGVSRESEQSLAQHYPDLCLGLERAGLQQQRRALRLVPEGLNHRWVDATTLEIAFTLPAGCFATAVLRELVVDLTEPSRDEG